MKRYLLLVLCLIGSSRTMLSMDPVWTILSHYMTFIEYIPTTGMAIGGAVDLLLSKRYALSAVASDEVTDFVREQLRQNRVSGYKKITVRVGAVDGQYLAFGRDAVVIPRFSMESAANFSAIDKVLEDQKNAKTPEALKAVEKQLDEIKALLSIIAQHLKNNTSKKLAYAKCVIPVLTLAATKILEQKYQHEFKRIYKSYWLNNGFKLIRGLARGKINLEAYNLFAAWQEEKADSGILKKENVLEAYKAILQKKHATWRDKFYDLWDDVGEWVFDHSPLGTSLIQRYYERAQPSTTSRLAKVNEFIAQLKKPKAPVEAAPAEKTARGNWWSFWKKKD